MLFLLLGITCSVSIAHLFKYAESKTLPTYSFLAVNYIIGSCVAFWGANGTFFAHISGALILIGIIEGILFVCNYILMVFTIKKLGVTIPVSLMRLSAVLPTFGSILFFSEIPHIFQFAGILLAFFSLPLATREPIVLANVLRFLHEVFGLNLNFNSRKSKELSAQQKDLEQKLKETAPGSAEEQTILAQIRFLELKDQSANIGGLSLPIPYEFTDPGTREHSRGFAWGLMLFVVFGITNFVFKIQRELIPLDNPYHFLAIVFPTAFVVSASMAMVQKARVTKTVLGLGMVLGVLNLFSSYFFMRALQGLSGIVVYPINGIGIILFSAISSMIIWKERLMKRNYVFIALASIALVLIYPR